MKIIKSHVAIIMALSLSGTANANLVNSDLSGFSAFGNAEVSSVDRINGQDTDSGYEQIQAVPGSNGDTSSNNEADAWSLYSGSNGINVTVTGLVAGDSYWLSYYQASTNRKNFPTTNINYSSQLFWNASLGGGSTVSGSSITVPGLDDTTPWTRVTEKITAGSSNEVLEFLAIATLSVDPEPLLMIGDVTLTANGVPEPKVIWLIFFGVLGLVGLKRRRMMA